MSRLASRTHSVQVPHLELDSPFLLSGEVKPDKVMASGALEVPPVGVNPKCSQALVHFSATCCHDWAPGARGQGVLSVVPDSQGLDPLIYLSSVYLQHLGEWG